MNAAATVGAASRLEIVISSKSFGGTRGTGREVLRDLRFSLPAGSFGALIGPSGCGKTTVLRIIAGLDSAFLGRVVRPGTGRLAMVFQEPALLPWRTVDDNIRLCIESTGASGDGLDALLATLGLTASRGFFPGELSLGLARRVALARAFVVEPDLLLLDEPFVSLDGPTADRLRDELAGLHAALRPTTLLVTHDVDEALTLSDRVFVMGGTPAGIVGILELAHPRERRTPEILAAWRAGLDAIRSAAG